MNTNMMMTMAAVATATAAATAALLTNEKWENAERLRGNCDE